MINDEKSESRRNLISSIFHLAVILYVLFADDVSKLMMIFLLVLNGLGLVNNIHYSIVNKKK